jgi:hypothetical protein
MPPTREPDEDHVDVVAFTVRWPRKLREDLKKQAEKEERAFNTATIRAARAYLEDAKKKPTR